MSWFKIQDGYVKVIGFNLAKNVPFLCNWQTYRFNTKSSYLYSKKTTCFKI